MLFFFRVSGVVVIQEKSIDLFGLLVEVLGVGCELCSRRPEDADIISTETPQPRLDSTTRLRRWPGEREHSNSRPDLGHARRYG